MKEINDSNFTQDVLKAEVPVMVFFTAKWCSYCRVHAPDIA